MTEGFRAVTFSRLASVHKQNFGAADVSLRRRLIAPRDAGPGVLRLTKALVAKPRRFALFASHRKCHMDQTVILGRLQQLTGNLKPAPGTSADALSNLQRHLAQQLAADPGFTRLRKPTAASKPRRRGLRLICRRASVTSRMC